MDRAAELLRRTVVNRWACGALDILGARAWLCHRLVSQRGVAALPDSVASNLLVGVHAAEGELAREMAWHRGVFRGVQIAARGRRAGAWLASAHQVSAGPVARLVARIAPRAAALVASLTGDAARGATVLALRTACGVRNTRNRACCAAHRCARQGTACPRTIFAAGVVATAGSVVALCTRDAARVAEALAPWAGGCVLSRRYAAARIRAVAAP